MYDEKPMEWTTVRCAICGKYAAVPLKSRDVCAIDRWVADQLDELIRIHVIREHADLLQWRDTLAEASADMASPTDATDITGD